MDMTRALLRVAVCAAILSLASCAGLTDEQAVRYMADIEEMLANGVITPDQAGALREVVRQASEPQWMEMIAAAAGIAGAVFGIPALQRVRVVKKQLEARGPAKPMDPQDIAKLNELLHPQEPAPYNGKAE
jgi:hypothetical protein